MKKTSVPLDVLFQALGDRTRLRLVNLLALGEVCVCYFVEILGEPQPKISRHLAYLRNAGVVSTRREGKWMHYQLAKMSDATTAKIVKSVLAALEADPQMQRDQRALRTACCSPKPLIADAPVPALRA